MPLIVIVMFFGLVNAAALIRGFCLLAVSVFPYRVHGLLRYRDLRTVVRAILSRYSEPFSRDRFFSLIALVHSSFSVLSKSRNPYAPIMAIASLVAFIRRKVCLACFLAFLAATRLGDYELKRRDFVVSDQRGVVEISEADPQVVGVSPNRLKRALYAVTAAFIRLYDVAYEPPNGVLISLGGIIYFFIAYFVRFLNLNTGKTRT